MSPVQILLGILFNTHDMTVSVTPQYRQETLHLVETTWNNRDLFYVNEIEMLIGKLNRFCRDMCNNTYPWDRSDPAGVKRSGGSGATWLGADG